MATSYNVQFDVKKSPGLTHVEGLKAESAEKASELLMLNHAKYHTYFNEFGLHNHIVHHLTTLWALGASPAEIQQGYDNNKKYQLPQHHHEVGVSEKLGSDRSFYKEHLGQSEFYSDYLHFFQDLVDKRGVEDIVKEYLFKGDTQSTALLGRMFAGFLHPLLHLGFGLEFSQPCLVAESLAGACIHDDSPLSIVLPVEKHLTSNPSTATSSYLSIISALRADLQIRTAVQPDDPPNRLVDGLLPRAGHLLPAYLSQWRVKPTQEDIDFKLAEMIHSTTFISGAAQHPAKKPSIEFFMMHSTNLSIFFPIFMSLGWLSLEAKARLLNWKAWMDMAIYAANGCPQLYHDRISSYQPLYPGDWESVIKRVNRFPDDGHTSKFIRAVMNAERISLARPEYTDNANGGFPLRKGEFLKIAHMGMDAVERIGGPDWEIPDEDRKLYVERLGLHEEVAKIFLRNVRWCGLDGAWDGFADLEEKARL
ncbi:hypothetical protein B0J11DRAFT_34197 [Dendryphion nanum]|uniref:HypA-like protein n=1 Tax=Dendryphion nanum TaxID=256645 RepID=A0A9P9ELD9_9PLEO|nr:hypothetical protein B0J11DRAFT_34197 [Dendryphion nanum]